MNRKSRKPPDSFTFLSFVSECLHEDRCYLHRMDPDAFLSVIIPASGSRWLIWRGSTGSQTPFLAIYLLLMWKWRQVSCITRCLQLLLWSRPFSLTAHGVQWQWETPENCLVDKWKKPKSMLGMLFSGTAANNTESELSPLFRDLNEVTDVLKPGGGYSATSRARRQSSN